MDCPGSRREANAGPMTSLKSFVTVWKGKSRSSFADPTEDIDFIRWDMAAKERGGRKGEKGRERRSSVLCFFLCIFTFFLFAM